MSECKCVSEVKDKEKSVEEESFAMYLLKERSKNDKKWFVISIALLVCWLSTIGAFLAYLNQYEFVGENYNVEQNTDNGGDIADSYVGVNGDIIHGIPKDNTN